MKYMGSKARISKHILPIILKNRKPNQTYVEPMVGGANSIDKVNGIRIGGELNEYIAPNDFKCVWQKEVKSSLSANGKIGGNKNSIERLFTYEITN